MKTPPPSGPDASAEETVPTKVKSTSKWPLFVLLAVAVIVPTWFWQQVWFGGDLSDEQIRSRLTSLEEPRQVQHACEQLSQRMQRDPQSARQFYDLLIAAADHPSQHIRYVVAWCMGEDATHYRPFQQTLVRLAKDPDAKVRYNAALALVRFGDDAARPVLREMLVPHTVLGQWQSQPEQGIVVDILDKHDPVRPSTQLALIDAGQGEPLAVLAPLGGRIGDVMVRTGDRIGNGTPLCTIQPGFQQAYEALRGLAVVGESEALPYVEPYLDPEERFSHAQRARVQTPARLTADAIKARQQHATKPAPGRIPIHREIPSGKRARGGSDDE